MNDHSYDIRLPTEHIMTSIWIISWQLLSNHHNYYSCWQSCLTFSYEAYWYSSPFIWEHIEHGEVAFHYTEDMLVDIFTKALPCDSFKKFRTRLSVLPAVWCLAEGKYQSSSPQLDMFILSSLLISYSFHLYHDHCSYICTLIIILQTFITA